jgi:hypothetical protein
MKLDMPPEAITARLRTVGELRRLGLGLRRAGKRAESRVQVKAATGDATSRTDQSNAVAAQGNKPSRRDD